jgi:outer membrane protein TolC
MPVLVKAREAPIEALPLEEQIQRRAYELYVERGNQSGSELDDWLQAEQEVLQESHQQRDWSLGLERFECIGLA